MTETSEYLHSIPDGDIEFPYFTPNFKFGGRKWAVEICRTNDNIGFFIHARSTSSFNMSLTCIFCGYETIFGFKKYYPEAHGRYSVMPKSSFDSGTDREIRIWFTYDKSQVQEEKDNEEKENVEKEEEKEEEKKQTIPDKYSDISIQVEDKIYPLHKIILATKSKYFDTMFTIPMAEKEQKIITIEEMLGSTFENVLQYIYFNIVNVKDALELCHLYEASELFGLDDLKKELEKMASKYVDKDSVLDLLIFGEKVNNSLIKNYTLSWLKDHKSIMKNMDLTKLSQKLLIEIIGNL